MTILKRNFILLFLLFSQLIIAQTPHYYILFSARFPTLRPFSIGGHAFITWRNEDPLQLKSSQFTYGFYPTKGMGILKDVDGTIKEGYAKNSNRERLVRRFIIEVDSAEYAETLQEVEVWKSQAYSLYNNNCIHFMNAIAVKLGLKPASTRSCIIPMYPFKFIRKLKKINKLRIVKNKYLENARLRIMKKAEIIEEMDDDVDE
jgi:hypothetical protein